MPKKTPEEWNRIRVDAESGDYTMKQLAAKYEVSVSAMTQRRAKQGWTDPRTGESFAITPRQKAATEPVPAGEAPADLNKEQVDAALEEMKTQMLEEPDIPESEIERLQRENAEIRAELADLKPVTVEWAFDFETAARMAASEMDDRIQMELNSINDERAKRMLPYYTIADKDRATPGWSKTIHDQIVQDMVDALTRHASNEGPSIQKIDMLRPDGVTKAQIPVGPNIDNGKRPERLLSRGWRQIANQTCHRWNCYGQLPEGNPHDGFHSQLHKALFDWQFPEPDRGVTTTGVFSGDA